MIERYTRERMGKIWDEKSKFINWVRVEVAVLMAKLKTGELNVKVPDNLVNSIRIIVKKINQIEKETKHDVIAFLIHTSKQLPKKIRPYWHDRMTSYDTQDTALSLQLLASIDLFQEKLAGLMKVIKKRALVYKYTLEIGRTHGIHAELITFGVKLANWYDELKRHRDRLKRLKRILAVGKISGAVGMYTLPPEIEELACENLDLKPIIATQIISRDLIAEYLNVIAIIGGTIEKITTELRNLQRTEILEVQEFFDKEKQRGSSAMPHKRNPIGSENLTGLSRVLRANAGVALENQATWHERDISNSAPERIVLPDSSILLDYMLTRLTGIISKMFVYPERMMENIEITKGLIYSQSVQSLVAHKSGLPREEAYELVRVIAQDCWESRADFLEELMENREIKKWLSDGDLISCFDSAEKVNKENVDHIFKKVFGR